MMMWRKKEAQENEIQTQHAVCNQLSHPVIGEGDQNDI